MDELIKEGHIGFSKSPSPSSTRVVRYVSVYMHRCCRAGLRVVAACLASPGASEVAGRRACGRILLS